MDCPIRLKGVTKAFGSGSAQVAALRGINLDISDGELFMIVGPSGCGKTTLVSIMAGILEHDAGEVELFGVDLRRLNRRDRADFRAMNVGFVFQGNQLIPTLSAVENVAIPLMLRGVRRKRALERAREVLDSVGMGDRHAGSPATFSGGEQQRVAIARAIVHDPCILVCDEPTSALDHEKGRQVMHLLREVAIRPGRALVVVTHDNRIFRFADRMATMEDGHIVRFVRRRFDPAALEAS